MLLDSLSLETVLKKEDTYKLSPLHLLQLNVDKVLLGTNDQKQEK
jgi:hypothetical protein